MKYKQAEIKAVTGNRISGWASRYGNVDSHGDVIEYGAFAKSVAKWKADKSLSPIYLFKEHRKGNDPVSKMPIGKITELEEVEGEGLWLEAELTPNLSSTKSMLIQGLEGYGLSIGYFADSYYEQKDIRYLTEVDLLEVSLVENPSNEDAIITEQKSNESLLSKDEIKQLIQVMEMVDNA
ncbi:HK97 family phage prohead protease [Vibrio alginolyticus]